MDTQTESELPPGWRATCAAGIVAAALLSSCERASDPNEVHAQAYTLAAHGPTSDFYVEIDDGIVTVRARDAPLHAVIEKLAEHSGLLVLTKDRMDQRVTVELHSLTLTAALEELLRGRNFVLDARQTTDAYQGGRGTLWILSKELDQSGADVPVGFNNDSRGSARSEELESLDELSAALADHDPDTRIDAVSELSGRIDDEQAAMMLAYIASRDQDPSVRAEALHAIGGARVDIRNPVLTGALTDRDTDVRKAAISSLEDIGAENSIQVLAIALKDRDASVRATAVGAIGEIGGDDALRLLESALADESAIVREAATERLVQTASSREKPRR